MGDEEWVGQANKFSQISGFSLIYINVNNC